MRRIWRESGYLIREGLGGWKVGEKLGWGRQQTMLEGAAMAPHLLMDGQVGPVGTVGYLLTTVTTAWVSTVAARS